MPDRDLAAQLRACIDESAPPVTLDEIVGARPTGAGARHLGWAAVLVAAAVLVGAMVVVGRDSVETVPPRSSPTAPPATAPRPTVTSTPPPVGPRVTDSIDVGGDPQGIVVAEGSVWAAVSGQGDEPPRLVQVDAATREVIGTTDLPDAPADLAAGDGVSWVATNGGVMRVDPATDLCTVVRLGGLFYTGVTVAFGSVWAVALDQVVRIDPATNEVVARFGGVQGGFGIAAGAGSIWVAGATDPDRPVVTRIDPATNTVEAEIPVPSRTRRLVATDTAVYATVFVESPGGAPGGVYRIDPATNEVTHAPGGAWVGVTTAGDHVWTVSHAGAAVGIIPTTGAGEPIAVDVPSGTGSGGDAIAHGAGAVWAASAVPGHLVRIDPGPYG